MVWAGLGMVELGRGLVEELGGSIVTTQEMDTTSWSLKQELFYPFAPSSLLGSCHLNADIGLRTSDAGWVWRSDESQTLQFDTVVY